MKLSLFCTKKAFLALLFAICCPIITSAYTLDPISTSTSNSLTDVWGPDYNHVFAVGAQGTLLKYDGSVCSSISTPTSNALHKVSGSSASNVWAVGGFGAVVHYNGTSATVVDIGVAYNLTGVTVLGSNDVYICGWSGTLGHYNGSSFSPLISGYTNVDFLGMFYVSSNDIYLLACDNYGSFTFRIYHFDGSGLTELRNDPFSTNLQGTIWSADNNKFYLPGGSSYYCFNKTAGTMTPTSTAGGAAFCPISSTDFFGCDDSNNIIEFNGTSWTTVVSSAPFCAYAICAPNNDRSHIFLVGNSGLFYKLDMTAGVEEQTPLLSQFLVSPNPAVSSINISLDAISQQKIKLELYNNLGQKVAVLSERLEILGNKSMTYDVSTLPKGLYFIRALIGDQIETRKLILTN